MKNAQEQCLYYYLTAKVNSGIADKAKVQVLFYLRLNK